MSKVISFAQMGDYAVPVYYLLSHVTTIPIIKPQAITNQTIELGCRYSPEFICMPFKFTLGTFIESARKGANILLQMGGGCRYGYYSELQEQILKDLGYSCQVYSFITAGSFEVKPILKIIKQIDPSISYMKLIYYGFLTAKMVQYMDQIDHMIRASIGFEANEGEFEKVKKQMLQEFSNVKNITSVSFLYRKYKKKIKNIPLKKVDLRLKVGIIGELYTIMEPFANYKLEKTLASFGIEVKRFTNAQYLLFQKRRANKKYIKKVGAYANTRLGADALDNIARLIFLAKHKYHGAIHIKSSFCTPEIGVMPILSKISSDYHIPILYFTFDAATSEIGIETRLEAFYDMIERREENERMLSRN